MSISDFELEIIDEDEMVNTINAGWGKANTMSNHWLCMTGQAASIAASLAGLTSSVGCCNANTCTELGCC